MQKDIAITILGGLIELEEYLNNNEHIVIYGVGYVGQCFMRYCEYNCNKHKIKFAIVSSAPDGNQFIREKKVISLLEHPGIAEMPVMITTRENLHLEIGNALIDAGAKEIVALSNKCIKEIEIFCRKSEIDFAKAVEACCQALEIRDLHKQTFGEFKNKFYGKDVAIIATGPSLNNYKMLENVIHIGVNSAFKKIPLDYLFFQDYLPPRNALIDEMINLPCIKFFGRFMDCSRFCSSDSHFAVQIPESKIMEANARAYYLEEPHQGEIHKDITCHPVFSHGSVVFAALQFALFGNPRRIYLVGCDCADTGHFDSQDKTGINSTKHFEGYVKVKKFATHHYPDTEIISINPIGLKGLFKDYYQEQ